MAKDQAHFERAMQRGKASNERQQWQQAFHSFRIALQEFPQHPEAYAGLGEACFGMKMLDRALQSYKLAARYSRGDLQYLQRVADLQERLGELSEAARTYMAAGELQLRQRNLDIAISNWQRAARLEPGLLGPHRRLAMVFQRQGNVKAAVREYLAIARILQMRGAHRKAMQMCQAALRLDPENENVLMAMELVRHGEEALHEEEKERSPAAAEETGEPDEMAVTVRQITEAFEEERRGWHRVRERELSQDPIAVAMRRAQDELAEEIFRDEEDEEFNSAGSNDLSKLERDALVGQGIDFQSRGQVDNAIESYERAVRGGLRLPAVFFILGILYLEREERDKARAVFSRAAREKAYRPAVRLALAR